jgi:hypothetical protein
VNYVFMVSINMSYRLSIPPPRERRYCEDDPVMAEGDILRIYRSVVIMAVVGVIHNYI